MHTRTAMARIEPCSGFPAHSSSSWGSEARGHRRSHNHGRALQQNFCLAGQNSKRSAGQHGFASEARRGLSVSKRNPFASKVTRSARFRVDCFMGPLSRQRSQTKVEHAPAHYGAVVQDLGSDRRDALRAAVVVDHCLARVGAVAIRAEAVTLALADEDLVAG
jgi:hypothetical protein